MGKTYTQADVVAEIASQIGKSSYRSFGAQIGVSAAYICDILSCHRDVSEEVAAKFGFKKFVEKKVWFVREEK